MNLRPYQVEAVTGVIETIAGKKSALVVMPTGTYVTKAQVLADMKNAYNALAWAKPHCVCVYCEGEGCKHCQQNGWLCKGLWASAPEEYKR